MGAFANSEYCYTSSGSTLFVMVKMIFRQNNTIFVYPKLLCQTRRKNLLFRRQRYLQTGTLADIKNILISDAFQRGLHCLLLE